MLQSQKEKGRAWHFPLSEGIRLSSPRTARYNKSPKGNLEWSCDSGEIQRPDCRTSKITASRRKKCGRSWSTWEKTPRLMTIRGFDWVRLEAGRYLKVVFVPDLGGEARFVVTAYDLTAKGQASLSQSQRRKNK